MFSICSKFFEKLTLDNIREFIRKSNPFDNNQSRFRLNESHKKPIANKYNNFNVVNTNLSAEVCDKFLDLSISFARVKNDTFF